MGPSGATPITRKRAYGKRRCLPYMLACVTFCASLLLWHARWWHAQHSHWHYLDSLIQARSPLSVHASSHLHITHAGLPRPNVEQLCVGLDFATNVSCPRYLTLNFLASAGFGHQFSELLFAIFAAQNLGLSFTWSPIVSSIDHGDDYSHLIRRLGLEELFLKVLHASRTSTLPRPVPGAEITPGKSPNNPPTWISSGWDKDKRTLKIPCNSVLALDAWYHCHGVQDNNCFWAPEHEFLFQRYAMCFRAGVRKFGTAFDDCVLFQQSGRNPMQSVNSASKVVTIVWHIRLGDVVPHKIGDAFYERVVDALGVVLKGYEFTMYVVGGGSGGRVSDEHVSSLYNMTKARGLVGNVAKFWSDDLTTQFLAMMQADVLIGSGSSLPQVAALLSGIPLFFNHEPKHGYWHGMEATWDTIDMRADGQVLDSLRRIRIMLFDRLEQRRGDYYGYNPCRRGQRVGRFSRM
jgi:hypothetical protein